MENRVDFLIEKYFDAKIKNITLLGGGFYGRVFGAVFDKPPYHAAVKLYFFPGFAKKEALQLQTLAEHSLVPMPRVYAVDEDESIYEAMIMEYLEGVNAGDQCSFPEDTKKQIAEEIIDNLLSYHHTIHEKGFGKLDSNSFVSDWRSYYRPVADNILRKARILRDEHGMEPQFVEVMEDAVSKFDWIFNEPITQAKLIHGDYNTWNVMLTKDKSHVAAVIDPFNCMWADSEYDLYQLDNANGKKLGLLELYAKKEPLSKNFKEKRAFYEVFTEINHFYDSGVDYKCGRLPEQIQRLKECLAEI